VLHCRTSLIPCYILLRTELCGQAINQLFDSLGRKSCSTNGVYEQEPRGDMRVWSEIVRGAREEELPNIPI